MNGHLHHAAAVSESASLAASLTGIQAASVAGYALVLFAGVAVDFWLWRRALVQPVPWGRRLRYLSRRSVQAADLLILLFAVLVSSLAGGAVIGALNGTAEPASSTQFIVSVVFFHGVILLAVCGLLALRGVGWRPAFGIHLSRLGGHIRMGAVAYLAMMPAVFVCMFVTDLFLKTMGVDTSLQEVAEMFLVEAPWITRGFLFFLGVVVAPFAEEVVFRGLCLPVLVRRLGVLPAMIGVSLLFAAVHGHLPSFLPLFVVSMAFCLAYICAGSIIVPVVMHMLFNAVNLWLLSVLL